MRRSTGWCSARAGRRPRRQPSSGRELRPVPKELGEGLRQIADPELRACLESLAAQAGDSSAARRRSTPSTTIPFPIIRSE